ncbi:MAG: hypothetical protein AAGA09_03695 [Pseudomonadota bacterium]
MRLASISFVLFLCTSLGAEAATVSTTAILTERPCTDAITEPCTINPYSALIFEGGVGVGSLRESFDLPSGSAAFAEVEFDSENISLPVIRTRSQSASNTRVGSTTGGAIGYTWNGAASTEFALEGAFTFNSSGSNGAYNNEAGESLAGAWITLLDADFFPVNGDVGDAFALVNASCGDAGVIGRSFARSPGAAGALSLSISLGNDCAGNPITLNPGDSFLVGAIAQSFSNRGGFADASNTFVVDLSSSLGADVLASLRSDLTPVAIPEIPIPGALWLFASGLGLIGARFRRSR